MPVLDASVLIECLAGGEHAAQARERLLRRDEPLWAPHLVDAEVGHVVRRAVVLGELGASQGRAALQDLADLPLNRAGHTGLLERARALRANLTFCDALYVALAERLDMAIVTLDGRMAGAPGIRAVIDVVA